MQNAILYIGRLLLGGYFLYGGFNHFKLLTMMSGYAQSKGVPAPRASVALSGLLLWVGGLSVLLGVYPTIGSVALVLFLIPVTFIMHPFWKVQDPQARAGEQVNFTKNLALLGAVLMLLSLPDVWGMGLF